MCVSVHVLEPFHAHVSVYLSSGQRNVTEQLLNGTKVGSGLNQVRRKGVPERMRGDVRDAPCRSQLAIEYAAHGPWRKGVAARRKEHRVG